MPMIADWDLTEDPLERRKFQRVAISLAGRLMRDDRQEFPCRTIDMSPGGLALATPVRGTIGERIVVYLDDIGRLEGSVVRHIAAGFALVLHMPSSKRDKIADHLTWFVNRHALGRPEERQHERIVPNRRHAILRLEDEREFMVKLIDMSVSGAALLTDVDAPIGAPVLIGRTPGHVARIFSGGLAVAFDASIPIEAFHENIKL